MIAYVVRSEKLLDERRYRYWTGGIEGWCWTHEKHLAVWFSRKCDAERMIETHALLQVGCHVELIDTAGRGDDAATR